MGREGVQISALFPPDTDPHIRTKYQGVFELFFDDLPPPKNGHAIFDVIINRYGEQFNYRLTIAD